MPKASPIQNSFSAGEFSELTYGRTDAERYKTAVAICLNYIPTLQGPMIRAPGTKYVTDAKDASKPPSFIPFQFSQTQNYVLEFGDQYIRFFSRNAQVTTTSTNFKVAGTHSRYGFAEFYGMRSQPIARGNEIITATSVITASSVLEISSPYAYYDAAELKFAQKDDTLYLVHSSYPTYKLQRFGALDWNLSQVITQDGPYLPVNSYKSTGDSAVTEIWMGAPVVIYVDGGALHSATSGPVGQVSNAVSGTGGRIRLTVNNHNKSTGDRIVVLGVAGTVEANNGTSSIGSMSWPIEVITGNTFDLIGSQFSNAYVGSGQIFPALWQPYNTPTNPSDLGRTIGLINASGGRTWGKITSVTDMARVSVTTDQFSSLFTGSSANQIAEIWQLGIWSKVNGYPQAVTFHQNRLSFAGAPQYPQRLDLSVSNEYENFAASGSSLVVADNSACSYNLASEQLNTIFWMKSTQQGLLAGSMNSEWKVSPNNQAAALTPTNVSAVQTSFFGSANIDAVQTGNATLYVQRSQRKIRELNYFFQVDTFRSTDLTELSEHITAPSVTRLAGQKETIPILWSLRSDGVLAGMVYNRDDTTLKVGWFRRILGGQSDSAGTAPVVKTIAAIPAPDSSHDQLWMAVRRFINGTSVLSVEYATKMFDGNTRQDDAFQVDCGATFDNPVTITGITVAGSSVVTAPSHNLSNGDTLKIQSVVGLNSSSVDINGIAFNSSLVNEHTFIAGSVATNTFFLKDFDGNYVDSRGYSPYFSGGQVRKLVSTISGFTWLKNETVGVWADGGIHPVTQINSAGVLALSYPAAKVTVGYNYNSDGKTLRPEAGAADGSSIGKTRRPTRVAFMLRHIGDFNYGTSFDRLTPFNIPLADNQSADVAAPLFSGIIRDGLESVYDFDGQICFRQGSPGPGVVQTVTTMMDEFDV